MNNSILISGKFETDAVNRKVLGYDTKYVIKEAVTFFCDCLNIRNTAIQVRERNVYFKDEQTGMCFKNSDTFIIYVKTISRNFTEIILTLAHELVHVMQFVHKNLSERLKDKDKVPYDQRDWEEEAYRLEEELLRKFVSHLESRK